MNRTPKVLLLVVAVASVVTEPALARAADYHHVHLTTSNATEAVKWYERHLDCQPLADRGDAVDCGGAQVVFDSRPTLGTSQRTGIDDPTVWTSPWTGVFTYVRGDTQYGLVEYACHEGNYGMTNILSLSGAREAEEGR